MTNARTKRDELLFLTVFALPKDSRIGDVSRIICSTSLCFCVMDARYWRISFVVSVLPLPESPLRSKALGIAPIDRNHERNKEKGSVPDNHSLVLSHFAHGTECCIGRGKNMRWQCSELLADVCAERWDQRGRRASGVLRERTGFHSFLRIDGQYLIRIHGHQNGTDVGLRA